MFKAKYLKIVVYASMISLLAGCLLNKAASASNIVINSPEAAIQEIYDKRSEAFLSEDTNSIRELFDMSQKKGQWAFEHEVKRIKYFSKWCADREMDLVDLKTFVRVKKCTSNGETANLALEETYKVDYVYPGDVPETVNTFGVGIRHWVKLINKQGKWIVYSDWYTDCFEDALRGYSVDIGTSSFLPANNTVYTAVPVPMGNLLAYGARYNRIKAVQYADKYCGAAWGSTNNYKYNPLYYDFNGVGGDCTNYVSQVLGDKKEGGAIPFGGGWHCSYPKHGKAQGSKAWTNASSFKNYLVSSGRARVVKKGTFKDLSAMTKNYTLGPVGMLHLGDLVAYEKKGDIDHFAVVTARDSRGYLLINSHTTDRYHVPWDLGWGNDDIRFLLIHITY